MVYSVYAEIYSDCKGEFINNNNLHNEAIK